MDYFPLTPNEFSNLNYERLVGLLVQICENDRNKFGILRWIGKLPCTDELMAGLEMQIEDVKYNNGSIDNHNYFLCPDKKGLFVPLFSCLFNKLHLRQSTDNISDYVAPITIQDTLTDLIGKNKGIQGYQNSCYLDATLFSMFSFSYVFDNVLLRPALSSDIISYNEVQRILRDDIVYPLRKNSFVSADQVMKLRIILENLTSVSGLTCEEKDPEEFLQLLLSQIMHVDPLLYFSSGQEGYLYQLFVDKHEELILPTVQELFDQSLLLSDIKLCYIPSCLIIQMPRFGCQFKTYERILPNLVLDLTDSLLNCEKNFLNFKFFHRESVSAPRNCYVCGHIAEIECKQCFDIKSGLESISYCKSCAKVIHGHKKRNSHMGVELEVPSEFCTLQNNPIPRIYLELFAVICIHTSHYVTFVKAGIGQDAPWCFFDSMADRQGEECGYNIPEVVLCPDLASWLSEEGKKKLLNIKDDRQLPEFARRLLCDAYICFYQSHDMMMYM